jgi:dipeptidyl aminopeptidase/acylaminoacyl peptidase
MAERSPIRELFIFITVLGGLAVLLLGSCGGAVYLVVTNFGDVLTAPPPSKLGQVMELQKQDFAQARRSFQTRLTKRGLSPQPFDRLQVPNGVQAIPYQSDNLKLRAWVNAPAAGQPAKPAVLFLHGGYAFANEDWDQCQPFRDAGFVTMTPMLRGENGQQGHFSLLYYEVDDALAAAETLAKMPGVDENHIYVSGHHAGGTLALLAAMASKRFRAAASISAPTDIPALIEEQPLLLRFDKKDQRELQLRSPLAYASSFKCPVRLYYGVGEASLRDSTQKIAQRAKQAGIDAEAVAVPGEGDAMVESAMRQAVAFFKSK